MTVDHLNQTNLPPLESWPIFPVDKSVEGSDSFDTAAVGRTVDVIVAGTVAVVDSQPVVLARALGILDYILGTMPVVQLRHGEVDQQNGIDDENAENADHGHSDGD